MFTVQGKRGSLRINGFTLLEIMLAVGILGADVVGDFSFCASEHDGAAPVIGYSRQGFTV